MIVKKHINIAAIEQHEAEERYKVVVEQYSKEAEERYKILIEEQDKTHKAMVKSIERMTAYGDAMLNGKSTFLLGLKYFIKDIKKIFTK